MWIALAALLGFAVGAIVTFLVGIEFTGSAECDGPCFDKWDEVSYVSYAIGALTALGFGAAAHRLLRR
ncbi:MAG: hypothetical protein ACRD1T_18105 [Acidimicrobiia bacterium]